MIVGRHGRAMLRRPSFNEAGASVPRKRLTLPVEDEGTASVLQ